MCIIIWLMGEHLQRDAITSVDFTLSSRDEDVMDDIDRLRILILEIDTN